MPSFKIPSSQLAKLAQIRPRLLKIREVPEILQKYVGDLWARWKEPDTWIGVPTHQDRRVGTGVYKQAIERAPSLHERYTKPGAPEIAFANEERIVLFPTVPVGKEVADPDLMKKGLLAIRDRMDAGSIKRIVLPRIGTGQGGLKWPVSKRVVEEVLGGRDVAIVHPDKETATRLVAREVEAAAIPAIAAEKEPVTMALEKAVATVQERVAPPKKVSPPPMADSELKEQFARLSTEIEAAQARQQATASVGGGTEAYNTAVAAINAKIQKAVGLRTWAERALKAGQYTSVKQPGVLTKVDADERAKLQAYIKKQQRILGSLSEQKNKLELEQGPAAISPKIEFDWISPERGQSYIKIVDTSGQFNKSKLRSEFGRIRWDFGSRRTKTGLVREKTFTPGEVRGYFPLQVTLPAIRVSVPEQFQLVSPDKTIGDAEVAKLLTHTGDVGRDIFSRLRGLDPNAPAARLANETNYFYNLLGGIGLDDYRMAEEAGINGIAAQLTKELRGRMKFEDMAHLWQNTRYPDYIRFLEVLRRKRIPLTGIEGVGIRRIDDLLGRAGFLRQSASPEGPFVLRAGQQREIRKMVFEQYNKPQAEAFLATLDDISERAAANPEIIGEELSNALAKLLERTPEAAAGMKSQIVDLVYYKEGAKTLLEIDRLYRTVANRVVEKIIQQGGRLPVRVTVPYYSPQRGLSSFYINLSGLPGPKGPLTRERLHNSILGFIRNAENRFDDPPRGEVWDIARRQPNYILNQRMGAGLEKRLFPEGYRTARPSLIGEGEVVYDNRSALEALRPDREAMIQAVQRHAIDNLHTYPHKKEVALLKDPAKARVRETEVAAEARQMLEEIFAAAEKGLAYFYPGGAGVTGYRRRALGILAQRAGTEYGGDPIDLLHQIRRVAQDTRLIIGEPRRIGRTVVGTVERMEQLRTLSPTEFEAQAKTLLGAPFQAEKGAFVRERVLKEFNKQLTQARAEGNQALVAQLEAALTEAVEMKAADFEKRSLQEIFPSLAARLEKIGPLLEYTAPEIKIDVIAKALADAQRRLSQVRAAIKKTPDKGRLQMMEEEINASIAFLKQAMSQTTPTRNPVVVMLERESERARAAIDFVFSPIEPTEAGLAKHIQGLFKHIQGLFNRWYTVPGQEAHLRAVGGSLTSPALREAAASPQVERLIAGSAQYFERGLTNFIEREKANVAKFGDDRRDWLLHRMDQLMGAMSSVRSELDNKTALRMMDHAVRVLEKEASLLRRGVYETIADKGVGETAKLTGEAVEIAEALKDPIFGPVRDPERSQFFDELAQRIRDILKNQGGFIRFSGPDDPAAELVEKSIGRPRISLADAISDVTAWWTRLPEHWSRVGPAETTTGQLPKPITLTTGNIIQFAKDLLPALLDRGVVFTNEKMRHSIDFREQVNRLIGHLPDAQQQQIVAASEGRLAIPTLPPTLQIVANDIRRLLDWAAEYNGTKATQNSVISRDFFGRTEKYLVKRYLSNGMVELEGMIPVPGKTNWVSNQTFHQPFNKVNPNYRPDYFPHNFRGEWAAYNHRLATAQDRTSMEFFDTFQEALQHIMNNANWGPVSLREIYRTQGPAAVQKILADDGITIFPRTNLPGEIQHWLSAKALGHLSKALSKEVTAAAQSHYAAWGFTAGPGLRLSSATVWKALLESGELGIAPKKRFIGPLQPRKLFLSSYVKNPVDALNTYIRALTVGIEGNSFRKDANLILDQVRALPELKPGPQHNRRLYQAYKYMEEWAGAIDTSRPSATEQSIDNLVYFYGGSHGWYTRKVLQQASRLMSLWKLGNPMSALVNLTQTAINTYPVLGNHTFTGIKLTTESMMNPHATYKGVRLDTLAKAMDVDLYIPKWAIDGYYKGRKVSMFILSMFNTAEKINRATAAFGGYAKGLDRGWSHEKSIEFAKKWAVDRTQFRYGIEALPAMFRNPFVRFLLQFKPYFLHEVNFITDLVQPRSAVQRYDPYWKELSRFLIVSTAFTGLLGIPAVEMMDKFVFEHWKKDPQTGLGFSFLDELKRLKPELGRFGDVPLRGIGSVLGLDLSQRIGLTVDFENAAMVALQPDVAVGKAARAFSVWAGLFNDLRVAISDFFYHRDEIHADALWKALAPVQLWSIYYSVKSHTGKTPQLLQIGGEQLPIPLPIIEESGYVEPGQLRSPTKEGAMTIDLSEDPFRGYKTILKAIGGRLPEESLAGETYERYGPRGQVISWYTRKANKLRLDYLQAWNKGDYEKAMDIAAQGAELGLDAKDFAREQEQWERTLLERAARQVPTELRPGVFPELERVEPGLELPVKKRRKSRLY